MLRLDVDSENHHDHRRGERAVHHGKGSSSLVYLRIVMIRVLPRLLKKVNLTNLTVRVTASEAPSRAAFRAMARSHVGDSFMEVGLVLVLLMETVITILAIH